MNERELIVKDLREGAKQMGAFVAKLRGEQVLTDASQFAISNANLLTLLADRYEQGRHLAEKKP